MHDTPDPKKITKWKIKSSKMYNSRVVTGSFIYLEFKVKNFDHALHEILISRIITCTDRYCCLIDINISNNNKHSPGYQMNNSDHRIGS